MDKWLWAARFFKTRALASKACDANRIESNGHTAKPAREVRVGDLLQIKNESGVFQVEVLALSELRGPVEAAQSLFRESGESLALRLKAAQEKKSMARAEGWMEGRPSKRNRRDIEKFRGRG